MGTILEDLFNQGNYDPSRTFAEQLADVSLGQVSGGASDVGTSGSPDAIEPAISEFIAEEGGTLAIAYGEHLVGGHLVVHQFLLGPPPDSIFVVALGDGEWDSALTVWYAGEPLSVSPDATTVGYRFHRGTISTGTSDPVQGVDAFLPNGQAYSGTAYCIVKLPEIFATEDRPDKFRGRFRGKRVWDYECDGSQISYGYNANPANVAADMIRRYYEKKYYHNPGFAYDKFRSRINWPAWCDWWHHCQQAIDWFDGTTTRSIPRFECHIAFTEDANLADALDSICATCASHWQDDGELITFLPPLRWPLGDEYPPAHHFTESNIVAGSFSLAPTDIRTRPNEFVARFRNLDDPYLQETSVEIRRDELIKKVGKIRSERKFANMTISQAQRLLAYQARVEADNPYICSLKGNGSAMHVLPGDYVQVTHPIPGWNAQRCLVLETSIESAEKSADEIAFTLQKDEGQFYSDNVHTPIQISLVPFSPTAIPNMTWWLEAATINQADSTAVAAWNDKTASGFNLSQGTGANQPLYRTGSGRPYVQFDGVNDFLRRSSFPILSLIGNQNFTMFFTLLDTGIAGRLLNHANMPTYRFGISQGAGLLFAEIGAGTVNGFTYGPKPSYYSEVPHVLEIYRSGATAEIVVDGAVVVGTIPLSENVPAETRDLDIGGITGEYFNGRLYAVAVFNRSLAYTERAQMRTYMRSLADTSTVVVSLPAPAISSLSPTNTNEDGAQFTLQINGSSFVSGAVGRWAGSDRSTSFVSAARVDATINAADIVNAGTYAITVRNPDSQVSNSVNFTVNAVAGFDPGTLSGLVLWTKAEGMGLNNGDPVSTWADLSSAANDLTQVSPQRPQYQTNLINSKPALVFDGDNDVLVRADDVDFDFGSGNFSIYFVMKQYASNADATFLSKDTSGSDNGINIFIFSNVLGVWNGSTSINASGSDNTNWHIYTVQRTGTGTNQLTIYRNGSQVGQGTDSRTLANSQELKVGGSTSKYAFVYIAEIVVQKGFATSTDRDNMHTYLNGRYAIY
jgi:hypothetical protein